MLRGLGLLLPRRAEVGHQGQVQVAGILGPQFQPHLPHRFQKRQRLDVTHRTTDFDNRHIHRLRRTNTGPALDEVLYFIGDVRNYLNGLPEVVAFSLFANNAGVNCAGCGVRQLREWLIDEPLVVAEVKIGFGAVVGDEDFAVLEGGHRARIDVDVRIELDQSDFEAPRFKNRCEGG